MTKPVFALVDMNNFYASCERLWRPDLRTAPVVVLSNNDGCVVARSKEAKALGIKMGVPAFQIREAIEEHGIVTFSSNYALYADISNRVMTTLEEMAPRLEVYSIDEAFMDLTGVSSALTLVDFGRQVRERLQQWVGITACVGISTTKTLAKLANHAAKTWPATAGVVDLTDPVRQRRLMQLLPVDEVWGVGRRLAPRLEALGIKTARDLADANPKWIRQAFSVVLERTVRELNGESCIHLEEAAPIKQQIVCSRSFGARVTTYPLMKQAVASYIARAAEKLRGEGRYAKSLSVFIRTSPFAHNEPRYSRTLTTDLGVPTDDTRTLLKAATRLLRQLWKDGYAYQKAGVMLADFYEPGVYQPGLFDTSSGNAHDPALMTALDQINRYLPGGVFLAGQGVQKDWRMKRSHLSPAYTTRWSDLPKVR